jgi:galactokinase
MSLSLFLLLLAVVLAIAVVGGLVGYEIAEEEYTDRARELEEQAEQLQEQWDSLHRTQQLNSAFMQARNAMREEAFRSSRQQGSRWQ